MWLGVASRGLVMALKRQIHVRIFQERKNVFKLFDDEQLMKQYRLDRAGIIFVSDLVRDVISPLTLRSNAFSVELNECCESCDDASFPCHRKNAAMQYCCFRAITTINKPNCHGNNYGTYSSTHCHTFQRLSNNTPRNPTEANTIYANSRLPRSSRRN